MHEIEQLIYSVCYLVLFIVRVRTIDIPTEISKLARLNSIPLILLNANRVGMIFG